MRKFLSVLAYALIILQSLPSLACDQCGCAGGGAYTNLSTYAHNNYLMLKAGYYKFYTFGNANNVFSTMQSTDLIAGYNITPKIHLLGYLPFKINSYTNEGNRYNANGIGDAGLLANYIFLTNKENIMAKTTYAFSIKGGIELPTGKFIDDYRALKIPVTLSDGSGTIDYLTGLRGIYKKNNITLITDYSLKINTTNSVDYQFGSQQTLTVLSAFRYIKSKSVITPYIGVTGERDGVDVYHELPQHGTSGSSLFINTGLEIGFNKYIIGATTDFPVISQYEEGAKSSPRLAIRLAYTWN